MFAVVTKTMRQKDYMQPPISQGLINTNFVAYILSSLEGGSNNKEHTCLYI